MNRSNRVLTAALAISAALGACDAARNHDASAAQPEAPVTSAAQPSGPEPGAQPAGPAEPATGAASNRTAEADASSAKSGLLKFNNFCRTCHSMREGDHRLGPSLHGVIGREAGSAPGFRNYSQALANSGIVWDEETLDKFLANPDALVPGNNMKPFSRLPDPRVRQDIVAHIEAAGEKSGAAD